MEETVQTETLQAEPGKNGGTAMDAAAEEAADTLQKTGRQL